MLKARCPDFYAPAIGSMTIEAWRDFVKYLLDLYTVRVHSRIAVEEVVHQYSPRYLPIMKTVF